MALHVGVDAWNLIGDWRGNGRYVREIVKRWAGWQSSEFELTLLIPERVSWFARGRYLRELDRTPLRVRHRRAARESDVVWYPWNGLSWIAPVPSVATLHDASLFALPPADPRIAEKEQRPFRLAAALATRIITLTEFSKQELVKYLALDPARVDVIPLGVHDIFRRRSDDANRQTDRPYVLFVSEPEERKGLRMLLAAMAKLPPALSGSLELVIAGASGQYAIPELPPSITVRNLGWVSDDKLVDLYARASVFVYPSRYEGFGLPVVEAMAAGAPVITTNVPSMQDAAGGAARLVPPDDAAALAAAIEEIISNQMRAEELRQKGAARVKALTWDDTARRTLEVCGRAVQEASRVGPGGPGGSRAS